MPYADPDQQRAYQLERYHRLRREWLAHRCCESCGTTNDLEIHHRDPARKISHRIWSWSAERREAELTKCTVLCSRCHDRHHAELVRRGHGTARRYRNGCRCEECRAAHAARARHFRHTVRQRSRTG